MFTYTCRVRRPIDQLVQRGARASLAQQRFQTLPQRERYNEEVTLFRSTQHCSQFQKTESARDFVVIRLIETKIYIE